MKRTDPLTKKEFYPKRSNQRFENRENQIRYNNIKSKKKRDHKSQIDKMIDKNWKILNRLLGEKTELSLPTNYLLGADFQFGCLTHQVNYQNESYNAIYEFAYKKLNENEYRIIRHA